MKPRAMETDDDTSGGGLIEKVEVDHLYDQLKRTAGKAEVANSFVVGSLTARIKTEGEKMPMELAPSRFIQPVAIKAEVTPPTTLKVRSRRPQPVPCRRRFRLGLHNPDDVATGDGGGVCAGAGESLQKTGSTPPCDSMCGPRCR